MNHDEYSRLVEIQRTIRRYSGQRVVFSTKLFGMVMGALDKQMGKNARLEWLRKVSGNERLRSSKELPESLKFGLLVWASPRYDEGRGEWRLGDEFAHDCAIILKSLGQETLF